MSDGENPQPQKSSSVRLFLIMFGVWVVGGFLFSLINPGAVPAPAATTPAKPESAPVVQPVGQVRQAARVYDNGVSVAIVYPPQSWTKLDDILNEMAAAEGEWRKKTTADRNFTIFIP